MYCQVFCFFIKLANKLEETISLNNNDDNIDLNQTIINIENIDSNTVNIAGK